MVLRETSDGGTVVIFGLYTHKNRYNTQQTVTENKLHFHCTHRALWRNLGPMKNVFILVPSVCFFVVNNRTNYMIHSLHVYIKYSVTENMVYTDIAIYKRVFLEMNLASDK